jgi:hypothetical protein
VLLLLQILEMVKGGGTVTAVVAVTKSVACLDRLLELGFHSLRRSTALTGLCGVIDASQTQLRRSHLASRRKKGGSVAALFVSSSTTFGSRVGVAQSVLVGYSIQCLEISAKASLTGIIDPFDAALLLVGICTPAPEPE